MIDNHILWHEKLPFAFFAYHTTIETSTVAKPYFLVYYNKVVIPADIEMPSISISKETELSDAKLIQVCEENLHL